MKKLSLYKNNHHQSKKQLHEDNEQLSSILTVPLDKCSQLTQINQFARSAESMKKLFLLLEIKKYDIAHACIKNFWKCDQFQ